ncbi:hypothetical protein [Caulobacter sp.]|uniref:hypothetical protein n=1 Tax=Caulobacter sp. TaxID=78 RepID=UPI00161333E6
MNSLVPLMIVAAASLAAGPASPPLPAAIENAEAVPVRTVYRVKQQGGGLGIFIDEAAVFYEIGKAPNTVWVLERRRRDQKMGLVSVRHEWVDGRTCPALAETIGKIARLPPVSMAGLDTTPKTAYSDSSDVTLMGPAAGGASSDFALRRDTMGPTARWWWDAQKALEPCWAPRQPYLNGAYSLRSRLSSAQDEVEVMRP